MLKLWWRLRTTTQKYWASQVVLVVSRSVVPDSLRPHGLQSTRLLCPWNFPRKLPFPSPGNLPDPRIEPWSPALQADSLPTDLQGKPANAGDKGELSSRPGWKRSLGGKHGNSLQYSCLENPMDREAWQARVHGVPRFQFFVCLGFFLCLLGCFCSWVRAMAQNYVLCISEITWKSYIELVDFILQGIFEDIQSDKGAKILKLPWVLCSLWYHLWGCWSL